MSTRDLIMRISVEKKERNVSRGRKLRDSTRFSFLFSCSRGGWNSRAGRVSKCWYFSLLCRSFRPLYSAMGLKRTATRGNTIEQRGGLTELDEALDSTAVGFRASVAYHVASRQGSPHHFLSLPLFFQPSLLFSPLSRVVDHRRRLLAASSDD